MSGERRCIKPGAWEINSYFVDRVGRSGWLVHAGHSSAAFATFAEAVDHAESLPCRIPNRITP